MLKNHLILAIRNLRRNKAHSIINISGLSVGMAIAILIGLWIWDELHYDHFPEHYDRIAQVRQNVMYNGAIKTGRAIPYPLGEVLRKDYGSNFKYVVMSSWSWDHIMSVEDKQILQSGSFMEAQAPDMFSLTMLKGSRQNLADPGNILLSQSTAKALFGDADPMNKIVRLDNGKGLKVAGVYKDFPYSSTFSEVGFLAPWEFYTHNNLSAETLTDWGNNSFQLFVEVADGVNIATASSRIKDVKLKYIAPEDRKYNPQLLLQPMSRWHLYAEFTFGVDTGGSIQYVWLFGIIGIFVLLLACINFMNLSTARSERRAKEVGIRKAIGSLRTQLITQFFVESILVSFVAFALAIVTVFTVLPAFNLIADKKIEFPWHNPFFWTLSLGFATFTGIIAGSYPAFYLSSFKPVKVLKGVFKAGPRAAIPRKALVVLQFTVSVILIVGTIMVFRQIQFAMNREVGYTREGLININLATDDIAKHFEAFRNDCKESGLVSEVALATSPTVYVTNNTGGLDWQGKDPNMPDDFANIGVSPEYGATVGWQFTAGRDFSRSWLTDSLAIVLNEAAVKYMGFKNPVGQTIKWANRDFHVVGVIKDMVMQSPYEPVKQSIFYMRQKFTDDYVNIRIAPNANPSQAITAIAAVYKRYSPSTPFTFHFADLQYANKFKNENRIGKLASIFSILAIFISCLGLFGMASFMAEQRVKEIGVRKVLGASVFNLWKMLSKDFITLVTIALVIALPLAGYLMNSWLQHYKYRAQMPWWVFPLTAFGAILITLLTISYQGIRAALANPVKSLRSE